MAAPENEPCPPVPPDVDMSTFELETPELAITGNSMLYRVKGRPGIVYKGRGLDREYELQKAAGDCAIPVRGRVMLKSYDGEIICMGFLMDLATPLIVPWGPAPPPAAVLPPNRHRDIMHQMIRLIERLHAERIVHGDVRLENMLLDSQGELRLCDFGTARTTYI
ncbi:319c3ad1-af28-4f30-b098-62a853082285 [Thermothielavioides terrestris]|uniref:EKC/KEOPS complex subunit BUD32 n=1 Tax=Thermothielavioides terrestris TaxID=2587410 RepID=A0A446BXI1_9PEZI|nr:319c3ad1-af28-4f30-b098-62a853082285 [Thermothielavioides terrestris]